MSFSIQEKADHLFVHLSKKFELTQVSQFRELLVEIFDKVEINPEKYPIIVDFTNLDYIDSSGIGILLKLKTLCEKNAILFAFSNINPKIIQMFQLIDIESMFPIYPNKEAALEYLKKASPQAPSSGPYKAQRYDNE